VRARSTIRPPNTKAPEPISRRKQGDLMLATMIRLTGHIMPAEAFTITLTITH